MIFCSELSAAGRSTPTSTAPQRLIVPASTVSPTVFSTGVASPVRLDSSVAVPPLSTSASTGNCDAGLDQQAHAGPELFHRHFTFAALRIQQRGHFGRFAEERADFLLRPPERVMFERAGQGEQEQQRRPFPPRADARAADGDGEHQKMNVNRALADALPDFLRREPAPAR